MCPACITSLALAVVGATSAGGVSALVVGRLFARNRAQRRSPEPKSKEKAS